MFEKLSEGLKDALRKLTGAGYVDKAVLDELAKDIQKALLSSDVDVKLASELTERIKQRALNEKPPTGLTAKDHVIKIVYEELVKLVGEKSEVSLKPGRIMFIGLFGSGKCVHKDSLISLGDGRLISAEELYNEYSNNEKDIVEEGEVIRIPEGVFVPSFNPSTLKMESKRATHLWKLRKKELLSVYLDNGNDFTVKVTPEHPFFAIRYGKLMKIRADQLDEDDFVAIPRKYSTESSQFALLQFLTGLDLDAYLTPLEAKELVMSSFFSLKGSNRHLQHKRNYCKFTTHLKNGRIPVCFLKNSACPRLMLKKNKSKKPITFPNYLTCELAEFLGYVFGDGHLENNYVQISSENEEIINRVEYFSTSLFNIKPTIKRDSRTKSMYDIRISSNTLVYIINRLFGLPIGKKGKKLMIPKPIQCSGKDIIVSFLRAYFDCEAYPEQNSRCIEISSESRPMILGINLLLRRLGIVSTISKKMVNDVPYWRLIIEARYAELFESTIGFLIKLKSEKSSQYVDIGAREGCGKQDMIPLGTLLKQARESLGFSIGEIQEVCNSYGQYEKKGMISRESLLKVVQLYKNKKYGRHFELLSTIRNEETLKDKFSTEVLNSLLHFYIKNGLVENKNDMAVLTSKGFIFLRNISLNPIKIICYLESMATSDVCWPRVNKVEKCINDDDFVYDMTVEDNHSFVADGIIVHNTTSIGKLAKFYQKRGLRPALIGCDVHRPAAMEQLSQLASQINVPCYAPKDVKDPIGISKNGIEKFKKYDILIFDASGRSSLDKELADELKKLGEFVKPNEVLLTIPADLGQAAGQQAEGFKKLVGITGIFLTKMDGTARGGGAITSCAVTRAPIKFMGTGEKVDAIEVFDPERFISRLIGFGDIQGLLEKAKEAEFKPETAEKIMEGKFTMNEFLEQLKSMNKMGSLKSVMGMMPGLPVKIPKEFDMDKQEGKMKKWAIIIQSMTKEEKEDPKIIDSKRIARIAKGSGTTESDVRDLLKYYEQTRKMIKMFSGGGKRGMFSKFSKMFKGI